MFLYAQLKFDETGTYTPFASEFLMYHRIVERIRYDIAKETLEQNCKGFVDENSKEIYV